MEMFQEDSKREKRVIVVGEKRGRVKVVV